MGKVRLVVTYEADVNAAPTLGKAIEHAADLKLPERRQWEGQGVDWVMVSCEITTERPVSV